MADISDRMLAVIAHLESSLEQLQRETVDEIFTGLGSYADVTAEHLNMSIHRNMQMAVKSLKDGRAPKPETLDGAETTTTERFYSGVSIDQVIIAFRMSFSRIHEAFIDFGLKTLTPEDLIRGSQILSGVSDSFTVRAVSTFHRLQVESAVADASRKAAALRALLSGDLDFLSDGRVLPINISESYSVIRGHISEDQQPEEVRKQLEITGSTPSAQAFVVIEDDKECIGVVAKKPIVPNSMVVGIGPALNVRELPLSDQIATQSLHLARALNRHGLQGLPELNWRLATVSGVGVDKLFRQRFLEPVAELGEFAPDLLASVKAWLHHGRSIPRAAQALHVHVNTVRYRLGRFEELTGFDPDDVDDLIGLAWVLEMPDLDTNNRIL